MLYKVCNRRTTLCHNNIVVKEGYRICHIVDDQPPNPLVRTVENTHRYDPSATEAALGWKPAHSQLDALKATLATGARLQASGVRFDAKTDRLEGTRYVLDAAEGQP